MRPTSSRDSLNWPLLGATAAIAVISHAAVSGNQFMVSILMLVPAACAVIWAAIAIWSAIKAAHVLRVTSCVISVIFMYMSAQWILPGHDAAEWASEKFRFEEKRASYDALVANRRYADPQRTFILFQGKEDVQAGEVDQRIAYDETGTLERGVRVEIERVVALQSPDDAPKFSACRWKIRHLEAHYYAVDFFC
ncbi:hypothetical protein [Paraburkholderia sp. C35]|uniref:hypothetical protein n=1 Tax=Paraburkholderia sp. C35 TaxID=2126993 RepID=UPI0013A57F2F|nr:hypothetical protein [Paraburkholderia sp. C35]